MQAGTPSPHSSSLAQIVCDWNPSNLTELARAFSDSCSPPQTSFSAYHSYKAYFEPLLLAEISADLCSALDKYQRATLRQPKVRARREEVGTTLARVTVQKVTRVHTHGFGWCVDLESNDRRGPVGCVENDVVVTWPAHPNKPIHHKRNQTLPRQIHANAVLSVVVRSPSRTGCRLITARFPDGNENGVRTDLEEGEENEEEPPTVRMWHVLRLGSLTTMRREFAALQDIKASVLLPKILRPHLRSTEKEGSDSSTEAGPKALRASAEAATAHQQKFHSEYYFTNVISTKTNLNPSQRQAILHASTCRDGFAVIQGPPGTGKTRTLIGLLNVIHMTQYQKYYETLIASVDPLYGNGNQIAPTKLDRKTSQPPTSAKSGQESLLTSMMTAISKTASTKAALTKTNGVPLTTRAKRPRLLICAPSNSAVDEILTRLTRSRFVDGKGGDYSPELARIGAGDRVSESAKQFTAEGQAEAFLDRLCGEEMTPEVQQKAQLSYLTAWQAKANGLLLHLERVPKRNPTSHGRIIDLHEKLERMERDLRRLNIAASARTSMTREEKLRQIARTYVEDAQLVFATLSGSASNILTKKGASDAHEVEGALFDTVVIDEGAQATETSALIPMTLGASRCILVGDPQQLPATVLSSGAAGLAYGQSLLERVCQAGKGIQLLDTQYRMHPAISSFPRRYFYNGRLVDDESVQGDNRGRPFHRDAVKPRLGPYVFLDISEGEERRSRDDRSIFNPAEAELAALIYTKLRKEYSKDPLFSPEAKVPGSVKGFGVVTPYKRQMQELRQSFDRAGIPTGDVEIDTVDSFQGREKDVVVFSCVRTAAVNRGIGFVRDVRRMNVGLTRARASLIILGSAQALAEGSEDWAELVEDANSRGCLISVSNVSRCLLPPSPHSDPLMTAPTDSEVQDISKPEVVSSSAIAIKSGGSYTSSGTRPSLPSDPRKRAHVRDVMSSVRDRPVSGQTVDVRHAHTSTAHSENVINDDAVVSSVSHTPHEPTEKADDHVTPALQSTLEQMTKLLSEAGFHNTKAVEKTLRDHIRSGGALDLETVMAAAIATGRGIPDRQAGPSRTSPAPISDVGGSSLNKASLLDKPAGTSAPVQEQRIGPASDDGRPTTPKPSKPGHLAKRGRPAENGLKSDGDKKVKKKKKERAPKTPSTQGEASGSGWDMLFGGSARLKEEGREAVESKLERRDRTSEPGGTPDIEADQSSSKVGKHEEKAAIPKSDDKGKNVTQMKGRNNESQLHKAKRKWNDKERDASKPSRNRDFGSGFRGGRGMDRGKPHSKRPRSQGQDRFDQTQGGTDFGHDDGWASQVHFDPGMTGFSMVPNLMDQGMAPNPQAMTPLQAMQQQAMQQQLLQQHALQQQAMQQQVFQQQAMRQHQAMQQQALQQQALQQQAVLMQMSAAGMPHSGMAPNAYSVDFDGFNSGTSRDSGPSSRGGQPWGPGSSYGRQGRPGRGRGRQKGGRGRRY